MTGIILITVFTVVIFGVTCSYESHHLKSRGEGYIEHMLVALHAAMYCLLAALCLVGHAIVPDRLCRSGYDNLDTAQGIISREQ